MSKANRKIESTITDVFKVEHAALLAAEVRLTSHYARRDEINAQLTALEAERVDLAHEHVEAMCTANPTELDRVAARTREVVGRISDLITMAAAAGDVTQMLEREAYAAEQRAEDAFRDAWLQIETEAVSELKRIVLPIALKGWRAAVAVGTTERPFDKWLQEQFSPGSLAGFLPEGGAFAADIGIDLPERPPLCHYLTEERRRQIRMGATVNLSEVQS